MKAAVSQSLLRYCHGIQVLSPLITRPPIMFIPLKDNPTGTIETTLV